MKTQTPAALSPDTIRIISPENPNFDDRPVGVEIDTIVIHSMYSRHSLVDPLSATECHRVLIDYKVSAHFYIDQDSATGTGSIWASVPTEKRAWHAGVSQMPFADDSRTAVNDFSIGIELIATDTSGFSVNQYENLIKIIGFLSSRHPIRAIVGHDQIAPGRKIDPGSTFDWSLLKQTYSTAFLFL